MTAPRPPAEDVVRHPLPAALVHDLRTPLTQIIGYTEMLMEQAHEDGNDGYVPDLQKVRAAGYRLLALLDENFQSVRPSAPRGTSAAAAPPAPRS
ncbi:MAG TPA: histidine kinase dimerization/phospho-acceptor domain-containing protein [Longimicrobium sp.]